MEAKTLLVGEISNALHSKEMAGIVYHLLRNFKAAFSKRSLEYL